MHFVPEKKPVILTRECGVSNFPHIVMVLTNGSSGESESGLHLSIGTESHLSNLRLSPKSGAIVRSFLPCWPCCNTDVDQRHQAVSFCFFLKSPKCSGTGPS